MRRDAVVLWVVLMASALAAPLACSSSESDPPAKVIAGGGEAGSKSASGGTASGGDAGAGGGDAGFDAETVSEQVGPAGAVLSVGVTKLTIPPGALAENVEISVSEVDWPEGDTTLAPVIVLQPEGLVFEEPITVEVELSEEPEQTPVAYWTNGDEVEQLEPVMAGRVASVTNTHFSTLTISFERCGNGIREGERSFCTASGLPTRLGGFVHWKCDDVTTLPAEECDDGNRNDEGCSPGPCEFCNALCFLEAGTYCGDGKKNGSEQCDDGNAVTEPCAYGEACTVCDATCKLAPGVESSCGDGTKDGTEQCDDGNTVTEACATGQASCTVCSATCQLVPGATETCGDGNLVGAEVCDDGNTVVEKCPYGIACQVCGDKCTWESGGYEYCGDGTTNGPETCDDGNAATEVCTYAQSCSTCTSTCTPGPGTVRFCGDGRTDGPEACDDGNAATEECAYGETACTVCDATCAQSPGVVSGYCGDDVMNGTELCDGADLGGKTCQSLGFVSGALACQGGCVLDESGCSDIAEPRRLTASTSGYCALQADQSISCWGRNDYDALRAPAGTFVDVSLGERQGCAIRASDATLTCWGKGPAATGYPAGTFSKVSVGDHHACALGTSGALACWGQASYGEATPPGGTFVDVTVGYWNTCGIKSDGTAACWGQHLLNITGLTPLKQIAFAGNGACAIQADDTVTCAGSVVGDPGAVPFQRIAGTLNGATFCGIRQDNVLDCWGNFPEAYEHPGTFVELAVSGSGSCAQTSDDKYVCSEGGSTEEYGPSFKALSVSLLPKDTDGGCAILPNGTIDCWGYAESLEHAGSFSALSIGGYSSTAAACGISAGAVSCWAVGIQAPVAPAGSDFVDVRLNESGMAGCAKRLDGSFECFISPGTGDLPSLPGSGSYVDVDISFRNVCAVDTLGALTCWEAFPFSAPPPATGMFTELSMAADWGCAVEAAGGLVCFGNYDNPALPATGAFVAVEVSDSHACALDVDGAATCWARSASTPGNYLSPLPGSFTDIFVGEGQSCGRRSDGSLSCWGTMARVP